jgi:hypothetical protein
MNYCIRYHIDGDQYGKRRDMESETKPSDDTAKQMLAGRWNLPKEKFTIDSIAEEPEEKPMAKTITTH